MTYREYFHYRRSKVSAQVLHIQAKKRTPANTVVKLEDFDYKEGEITDPLTIVKNPNITLYP